MTIDEQEYLDCLRAALSNVCDDFDPSMWPSYIVVEKTLRWQVVVYMNVGRNGVDPYKPPTVKLSTGDAKLDAYELAAAARTVHDVHVAVNAVCKVWRELR